MSTTTVSSAMISSGVIPTVDPARNFIIDGNFTQWPEGNITGIANDGYGPALFANLHSGGEVAHDVKQAVSNGYNFMHVDITTAETAVAAGDYLFQEYRITGSDFLHIHEQTVTIQFTHNHTKTGTYCVGLRNSANNRGYTFEYTQSVSNTEEVHTETVTLDQSGTWLLTEADVGLRLMFVVMTGSTFQASADTWTAGNYWATSNQVAGADSASNNFKIGKVGLYLGSTAPSSFIAEPVATVKDQVSYYVQRWNYDQATSEHGMVGAGHAYSTSRILFGKEFDKELRVAPSMTSSGTGTFEAYYGAAKTDFGALSLDHIGKHGCRISVSAASGTPFTVGHAVNMRRDATDVCFIMADARH